MYGRPSNPKKEEKMCARTGTPIPRPPRPAYTPCNWNSLSSEEQRCQIRDLIGSPYWLVLPVDIQERFLDLYSND